MNRTFVGCIAGFVAVFATGAALAAGPADGLEASPTHINFGRVAVGDMAFVGVEVTNTGTTYMDPQGGSIESKGNVDSEFDPDGLPVIDFNDQCFGVLAPGESCTVTVRFWPMSVGERHIRYVLTLAGGESYSLMVRGVGY
jgi:hypothetical protein